MKHHKDHEKRLGEILKANGLNKPSDDYSNGLRDLIVETYSKRDREIPVGNPWIARGIFGMAVIWCLLFLYFFPPFSIQPVFCISILSFIAGLWALIALMRKQADFYISSNR